MKLKLPNLCHRSALFTVCSQVALMQPLAHASASELESELFGSDTEQSESAQSQDSSVSASATAPSSLLKEGALTNPLVLGGRLEVDTSINKRQKQSFSNGDMVRSGTAELYLDSRPAEGLRGFVKGAIKLPTSAVQGQNNPETVNLSLYEMWVKWGGSSSVYTTFGRQKLKWGAASFWNPTDFLAVETKDPLATFDTRPGADLLKIHLPLEKQGHNLYAIVDFNEVKNPSSLRGAVRAEFNFGFDEVSGELTTTIAAAKDQPLQLGLDLNTGLGPIDLIAEAAFTRKSKATFYKLDNDQFGKTVFKTKDRSKDTITQVVGGIRYDLKYSESDSANLSFEYFWNDAGYSDVALEAYSFIQGQSRQLYLARRYIAGSLFLAQPGSFNDTNFIFSALHNLTDKSWLAQGVFSQKILSRSTLELALIKAGGAGEFTGGIPKSVAEKVKTSVVLPEGASAVLDAVTDAGQDWALRISAGVDL
ncbi:MAG: hypothetical protein RJB13_2000 [Pseudomonadota bacterium]